MEKFSSFIPILSEKLPPLDKLTHMIAPT